MCRHHGGNLSSVTDLVTDHIDGVNTLLGASSEGEGRITFRVARLQVYYLTVQCLQVLQEPLVMSPIWALFEELKLELHPSIT